METLALFFLALPSWVVGAAFGALAGVVGYGVGRLLKAPRAAGAISAVLILQLVDPARAAVTRQYGAVKVVNDLEKSARLYSVLFRLHPEAKAELITKARIIMNGPPNQVRLGAQNASAEIVGRYFDQHLVAASDSTTHALLLHSLGVMKRLSADRPEACVAYYMGGKTTAPIEEFWPGFLAKESEMKADIIESAVAHPSLPPRAASVDQLYQLLVVGFKAKKYPVDALTKLDRVQSLPPDEGCAVGVMFTDVLGSMSEDQGAYVFKNLLYLSH